MKTISKIIPIFSALLFLISCQQGPGAPPKADPPHSHEHTHKTVPPHSHPEDSHAVAVSRVFTLNARDFEIRTFADDFFAEADYVMLEIESDSLVNVYLDLSSNPLKPTWSSLPNTFQDRNGYPIQMGFRHFVGGFTVLAIAGSSYGAAFDASTLSGDRVKVVVVQP